LSQQRLVHEVGSTGWVGGIERDERNFGVSRLWPFAEALNVLTTELLS
jgi:hypothetical protein